MQPCFPVPGETGEENGDEKYNNRIYAVIIA